MRGVPKRSCSGFSCTQSGGPSKPLMNEGFMGLDRVARLVLIIFQQRRKNDRSKGWNERCYMLVREMQKRKSLPPRLC